MKTEEEYKAEVLQLMRDLYPTLKGEEKERTERLFHELKENWDERTKNEIIAFVEQSIHRGGGTPIPEEQEAKWIAWLEKQGEQKPAYKVEPKFKVGDYIISNNNSEIIYHITGTGINELGNSDYVCEHVGREKEYNGRIYNMSQDKVDANFRLWTIQDAKDGDLIYVSTEEKGIQAIFREYKDKTIFFHCYLCLDFVQGGYMPIDSVKLTYPLQETHYKGFFEKMHEAGYTWNAEELKLEKVKQRHAWSEEDETIKNNISHIIRQYDKISKKENQPCWYVGDCLLWIQNIKGRVQPQSTWKPSDEQMYYLSWIANVKLGDSVVEQEVSKHLNELLEELKKLK